MKRGRRERARASRGQRGGGGRNGAGLEQFKGGVVQQRAVKREISGGVHCYNPEVDSNLKLLTTVEMRLYWAEAGYGDEGGISSARGGSADIDLASPGVSTRSRPAPDLFSFLASLAYDSDFALPWSAWGEKLTNHELLEYFFEDPDENDLLKEFAASRTDAALAAMISGWKADHKPDGQSFFFCSITRTEIVIARAVDDDHGYGSAIALSTSTVSAELIKLLDRANEGVVKELLNCQAWHSCW